MMNSERSGAAGMALGIVLAASACASTGHGLAVLDSESSTRPVPKVIQSDEQFAGDSARYLGEIDGYSYFAARPASGADHEACLIQVGATSDDWIGGCSTIRSDKVVELSGGLPRQDVALVTDDPSTGTLEKAGWEQQAENLWQRTDRPVVSGCAVPRQASR
ncbi:MULTISPECIES: hypothetical protein [Kocuria]|uniref:hypothetical protein n=1 Tax=Kocuria TaxID=57493 RepID=UPI0003620234|nr:hypothetical protein [Kocuria sp. UCD-OTCP]EYT55032.1 hypothetical protein H488_0102710 [Kocuria sp. UCD-OTCP]MCM3485620.1 hypothetical protein [Kocuria rosea]